MFGMIILRNGKLLMYDLNSNDLYMYSSEKSLFDEDGIYDLYEILELGFDEYNVLGLNDGILSIKCVLNDNEISRKKSFIFKTYYNGIIDDINDILHILNI